MQAAGTSQCVRKERARGGIASLELVMSIPLLVATTLIIFAFAEAGMTKLSVAIQARHSAWKKRARAHADQPLTIEPGLRQGTVFDMAERSVHVRVHFGVISEVARSRAEVGAAPWDDPDVHFEADVPTFVPHVNVLERLISSLGPDGVGNFLQLISQMGNTFDTLRHLLGPIMGAGSAAMNLAIEGAGDVLIMFPGLFEASRG
jgi:hypothetical protein